MDDYLTKFKKEITKVKSISGHTKRSQTQQKNWMKYRANYMQGIHSYRRRSIPSKGNESSILDELVKKSKSMNESFIIDSSVIPLLKSYGEGDNLVDDVILDIARDGNVPDYRVNHLLGYLLDDFSLLDSGLYVDILRGFSMGGLDALASLCEDAILDMSKHEYELNKPIDMGNIPVVYDFTNQENTLLDSIESYLLDILAPMRVSNVEVHKDTFEGLDAIYIDCAISVGKVITFVMYIGYDNKPRIECRAGEGRGREDFLPATFVYQGKINITPSMVDFPVEFIATCLSIYGEGVVNKESLSESRLVHNPMVIMNEVRYRKAIRHGKPTWVKVPIYYGRRKRILSYAQRMALAKARLKSHTSSADLKRKRSLSIGNRYHLYNRLHFR